MMDINPVLKESKICTFIEIRKTHKQYSRTCGTRNLARRFGVCNQTIEDVVYNRSWKGV